MKDKYLIAIKTNPLYLFLLPVFFVLHGFTENYSYIPVIDALILLGVYLIAAALLLAVFKLILKKWVKAALFVFLLFVIHFFFGTVQDTFRDLFGQSLISRYVFLVPMILLMLVALFTWIKKTAKPLSNLTRYLNILLLLLLMIDTAWLVIKITRPVKSASLPVGLASCEDCPRPDVYLIIMDEYAGERELKDVFSFDNSAFYEQLNSRGFQVATNSSSNYNLTPYSIASILNMDYLDKSDEVLLTDTYRSIGQSTLLRFLQQQGYNFYNYSYFDFPGQPSYARETFFPVKTKLITKQTFLSRLEKEMRFHLAVTLKSKQEIRNNVYYSRDNNEKFSRLTSEIASSATRSPKFVFTHLMMPHYPYYFDRNGKEYPFESLAEGQQNNLQHYIEYLQFANKHILLLVDDIVQKSTKPPLILLLSDHGFRHFDKPVEKKYIFSNLATVHLPSSGKRVVKDSMTNVNFVRTIINEVFHQKLGTLKDSVILIDGQKF